MGVCGMMHMDPLCDKVFPKMAPEFLKSSLIWPIKLSILPDLDPKFTKRLKWPPGKMALKLPLIDKICYKMDLKLADFLRG